MTSNNNSKKDSAIIQINNLKKSYYNPKIDKRQTVLNDFNLTINKGEIVSVVGESGRGKSTLLHLIGLLDKFDSGEIIIDGTAINHKKQSQILDLRATKFGFVFQNYALQDFLTAYQNIELPLMVQKINEEERGKLIMNALERVGMTDKKDSFPSELSGGQQQRVAIARAIVTNPPIILADEPTGNLDTKNTDNILSLFKEINQDIGTTIIIVTHDERVAKTCDRIIDFDEL